MKKELEKTAPEPKPTGNSFAEWRWPVVILSLGFMALIAFLYSLNAAKNTTIGTAKEIRETVKEVETGVNRPRGYCGYGDSCHGR